MCLIIKGIHEGQPFTAFQCKGDPDERMMAAAIELQTIEDDFLDYLAATDAYLESDLQCTLDEFKEKR